MSSSDGSGRCVVVDVSSADAALLQELGPVDLVTETELDSVLAAGGPVDLVVIGSLARSPLALIQRAHRSVPDAGVAVVTDDAAAVRRQASFAPDVPLDLLVGAADDGDLPHRLRSLRRASVGRRRHADVLAAVARHPSALGTAAPLRQTAVGPLLEHAPMAVLVANPRGGLLGWNRRAEALLNLGPLMRGHSVEAVIPGAWSLMAQVAASTVPAAGTDPASPPLQARVAGRVDIEVSAVASQTDQGTPVVLLLAVDVTASREAERERDQVAGSVALLGRISELLMESLDLSESLSRLARAVVPALADWTSLQVREEHAQLYDIAMHHRDPRLGEVTGQAEQLKRRRAVFTEPSRRAAAGERLLLPQVDADDLVELVPDPDLRSLVERLGMSSALAVPIPGRVGVLGSMLLANAGEERRFSERDMALAVEIGRRAGIALENARLFAGQRHLATELQQSLLTAPPDVPFADIAVRYVAAGQEAQVGGDWYDAFRLRGGDLVIVIGDVVGHDTRAAAAMGQLRALLRGIGYTTADDPDRVLTQVDEAMDGLELSTIASAVLAQLTPADDADPARHPQLRWSNAGHPPPVLLDPDGEVRVLTSSSGKADLLLGIDATSARHTEETGIPPGSTLLLYTDGLIERRGQTLDDGLQQLLSTVAEHAGEDLAGLCDGIVERLVPGAGEDDVAIVAVRPRPAPRSRTTRPDSPSGRRRVEDMNEEIWIERPPPELQGEIRQWELSSVAQLPTVRAELRRLLATSAPADADEGLEDRFLLAFEELASNGLRHGGRPVRARVIAADDGLLIEVSDSVTERPPELAVGRDPALGGLGLYLVARLTSTHGWLVAAGRKCVWAYCR